MLLRGMVETPGEAEAGNDTEYLDASKLLPAVRDVVASMKVGDVSRAIDIGDELAFVEE